MKPETFTLSEGDRLNPLWMRLSAHMEQRLAALRKLNDGDLPERETARVRGQIKELRALIALGSTRAVADIEPEDL